MPRKEQQRIKNNIPFYLSPKTLGGKNRQSSIKVPKMLEVASTGPQHKLKGRPMSSIVFPEKITASVQFRFEEK